MGYRAKRKTYRLVFDGDLAGLEITVEGLTLGEVREIQNVSDSEETFRESQERESAEFLARVTEWNLEDEDGQTLPITAESLSTLALADVAIAIRAWFRRCLGLDVPVPLDEPSSGGEPTADTQSFEASLPTETL